jgi:prepilin-type N-terminal cleavage/methylation domain-containing protein
VKEFAVKSNHPRTAGRAGFTLIEILVVIAIIAILVALLMGGVMAFMGKGPEVKTRNDILQLSAALQNFKAKYGFYPPDQIRLCSNYATYTPATNALDAQSLQAINRMFPDLGAFNGVAWAGPGVTLPATGVILEGDQALVFFLGGPPAGASTPALMGGFLTVPLDPIGTAASTQDRIKFMTFDAGRLKLMPRGTNTAAAYFPSYIDGFNNPAAPNAMPYVYFSSGSRANGYTVGEVNTLNVSAYLQTATTYQNSTTFQIISAGLDGQFGPGGMIWPPPGGNAALTKAGLDDMTNFTDVKLGNAP